MLTSSSKYTSLVPIFILLHIPIHFHSKLQRNDTIRSPYENTQKRYNNPYCLRQQFLLLRNGGTKNAMCFVSTTVLNEWWSFRDNIFMDIGEIGQPMPIMTPSIMIIHPSEVENPWITNNGLSILPRWSIEFDEHKCATSPFYELSIEKHSVCNCCHCFRAYPESHSPCT